MLLYAGGNENYLNARKHYVMSLNLQATRFNLRSAYGLISTCKAIDIELNKTKNTEATHDAKVNTELLKWAKSQLNELVETHTNDSALRVVNSVM